MKYSLQALELNVSIGITEEERSELQMVLCDVSFEADSSQGEISDRIEDVVNYQQIYDVIKELTREGQSWNLLEKLHKDIQIVLEKTFSDIQHIEVALTKFPFEDGAVMITK